MNHPVTPPTVISQEAAQLLYLALNAVLAAARNKDDLDAAGLLDSADNALNKANGI